MPEPEIVITHISNSSLAGQEQRFAKPRVTVGRDSETDVQFDPDEDLVVSHNHAEFYVEDGKLFIRDLGARNGTYVNQRRIGEPTELQPEDSIHFGASGPLAKARLGGPEPPPRSNIQGTLLSVLVGRGKPRGDRPAGPTTEAELLSARRRAPPPPPEEKPAPQRAPAIPRESMQVPRPTMPPRPRSRAVDLLILLAAVALGVGGAVAYVHFAPRLTQKNETAPATPAEPKGITALGRLEPRSGILSIGAPVGLTIKSVLVEEGQAVKRDDELVRLASYDAVQAELASAQTALDDATAQSKATKDYAAAAVEEARAAVQQVGKPLDLDIEVAREQVDQLKANVAVAVDDVNQLLKLNLAENSTQVNRQKLAEQALRRELAVAEKRLEQLRQSVPLRRAQAEAQLKSAIANQARLDQSISVNAAAKNVDRVKAQLEQAVLRAPRDGKILKIFAREGAAAGGRPVLELGDTRQMCVIAEVYETDVNRVVKGLRATISSPALPDRLHGEVEKVLWTIERNKLRTLDPTAPEDLRVVEVKICLLDDEVTKHRELLEKLINLQVNVRIHRD